MLEAHRSLQVPFGGVSRTSEPAMTQTKDGLHQADTELSHHGITETGQGTSQARLKSGQGFVCWLTSFLPVILEATSLYSGEKVSYFCFNLKCYSQAQWDTKLTPKQSRTTVSTEGALECSSFPIKQGLEKKKKEGQWGAGQHTLISTEDSWAPPSKSIWNSPVIKPRRPGASWRLKHKEQRHPTEDWEALPVRLPALNAKGMDLPFLIINLALVPETLPHCRRNSSPSSMQQAAIALKRETWRHEQFPK